VSDPALTPELVERIDRAGAATGRARFRHVEALPGNPLAVERRTFGALDVTLVRRPRWYYHYFGGIEGLRPGREDGLDEALTWLRAAGQRCRVGVSPLTADGPYMSRLLERGLRPDSFMSITYGPAVAVQPPPAPGVLVREDRETFLASRLLTAPDADRELLRDVQAAEFAEARCYVAEVDGHLAARAVLVIVDGVGSMVAGDTEERWRGRGAQSALLRRRIADAAAAGCDLVVSSAVPGSTSQRNQERAGLRLAYTRGFWVDTALPPPA
jgi:hypothetical protein